MNATLKTGWGLGPGSEADEAALEKWLTEALDRAEKSARLMPEDRHAWAQAVLSNCLDQLARFDATAHAQESARAHIAARIKERMGVEV